MRQTNRRRSGGFESFERLKVARAVAANMSGLEEILATSRKKAVRFHARFAIRRTMLLRGTPSDRTGEGDARHFHAGGIPTTSEGTSPLERFAFDITPPRRVP